VPTLDEHVRRGDHPAVSSTDDGRVVARAEQRRVCGGQLCGDPGNQAELPDIGNGDRAVLTVLVCAVPALRSTFPTIRGRKGAPMATVNAYILIQTEVGKAAAVAAEIASLAGVTSAEDVTGPYDVIVRAEADTVDDLGKLVVARVQAVDGITRTLTCPVVHL
jgi:DNA-binding Lrp family transcriptional regulator